MCIRGYPERPKYLTPREGITAWRRFNLDSKSDQLLPVYFPDAAAWRGRIAKARRRPTGGRGSNIGITAGLAEWYKERLLERQFETNPLEHF